MRKRSEKRRKFYEKSGGKPSKKQGHGGGKTGRRGDKQKTRGRDGGGKGGGGKRYVGRVQKSAKGFAFLIPKDARIPDVYVTREEALPLLNDDIVEFTISRQGRRESGEVKRVLQRGQSEVMGRVVSFGDRAFVEALDGELHDLEHGRRHLPVGDYVIARFEEYPTRKERALVSISQVLGPDLKPEHDVAIAISRFNLPAEFLPESGTEAFQGRITARREIDRPAEGRYDMRDLPFVTVDGEDAKDFDDAILVTSPSNDRPFVLHVAIADVSFFVKPGTALDDDAVKRSTSVYFPGTCLPMLPEGLSNDQCSLRPQSDRLVLCAEISYDREGNATDARFYEGIIKTARRLTYTELQLYFDGDAATERELKHIRDPLDRAYSLYKKLTRKRVERGVLDFDLPEGKIQVDEHGYPISMHPQPRYDAHKLIEEFMIAANSEVARALRETHTPSLYRVHEPPDPEKLDNLNQLLKRFGVSKTVKEPTPRAFAKILEATKDHRGAAVIHQTVLRTQKQAKYEPEPKGHFGLALEDYTHFTSPIRRYPDLVVHRSLKAMLKGKSRNSDKNRETDEERLEELGQTTSDRERRAMEAERWVVKRKQCWYMLDHIGEEYEGTVVGMVNSGIFVALQELAAEGFVPVSSLDTHYEFDEKQMVMRKRPGPGTISIGDKVRVRVEQVNLDENEITFGPAE